jgi:FixJ family two-component response regulator
MGGRALRSRARAALIHDNGARDMSLAESKAAERPLAILVDDDTSVRDALGELLNSVGIDSVAYGSARALLDTKLPDRPGCIILDVRMPGLSGIDLQERLIGAGVFIPIVFLTGHGDIAMSVQAMKAGAVDFLTKPVRDQNFLDAVGAAISADVTRRAAEAISRRAASLYETLTPRERQVLRAVVSGSMNKQIAYELDITEVTVKLHRSSMMRKMQATSITHLLAAWQSLPAGIRMGDT